MASTQMGEAREQIAANNAAAAELPLPSLEEMRDGVLAFLAGFPEIPGADILEDRIKDVPVEWTQPTDVDSDAPVLLYLHGGGYIQGAPVGHRRIVSSLAIAGGTRAVSVGYRLAPEHPFPAGLDDAQTVYEWLIGPGGVNPAAIVVGGDSAGAGLAAALMLRLRDQGIALPAGAVLISPHLSFIDVGESATSRVSVDPHFGGGAAMLDVLKSLYLPDGNEENPYASPLAGDLSGLPPTLIHVGDYEILLSHSTRFAEAAAEVGTDVELVVWPEAFHVFQFHVGEIPEAGESLSQIGAWISKRVG